MDKKPSGALWGEDKMIYVWATEDGELSLGCDDTHYSEELSQADVDELALVFAIFATRDTPSLGD